MKNIKKLIIILLIIGFIIYLGMAFYGNLSDLISVSTDFAWKYAPILLLLAFMNYVIRFFRWHYYIKISNYKVAYLNSWLIFNSGLLLSITPGKIGEVFKSFLLKKSEGIPMSSSFSLVVGERFTDLTAVLILSLFGVLGLGLGTTIFFAGIALVTLFLVFMLWQKPVLLFAQFLEHFKLFKNLTEKLVKFFSTFSVLVKPVPFVIGNVIGILAWGSEATAFYLLLKFLPGAHANYQTAVFIYSISTIAGAVSMLPGGILATEGFMVFMLKTLGVTTSKTQAVFATILIRLFTLWFAVLVGLISFLAWKKLMKQDISLNSVKLS